MKKSVMMGLGLSIIILIGFSVYTIMDRWEYWQLPEVFGTVTQVSALDNRYNAFPKVVWVVPNETMLAVWYNGDSHVDHANNGKIYGAFSSNFGDSWGSTFMVYDDPTFDCRNIGVVRTLNGTIILFFAKIDGYQVDYLRNYSHTWKDFGFIKSYDNGSTWSSYVSLITNSELPTHGIYSGNGYGDPVFIGNFIYIMCYGYPTAEYTETHMAFLLGSEDNGEHWTMKSKFAFETRLCTSETDFLFQNSLLFGFARTQGITPRLLHFIESNDTGATWTIPVPTNIEGDCPDIIELQDHRLLTAIRAFTSRGKAYTGYFLLPTNFSLLPSSEKTVLIQHLQLKALVKNVYSNSRPDVAYPSILTIGIDTILVVYYDIDAGGVFAKRIPISEL